MLIKILKSKSADAIKLKISAVLIVAGMIASLFSAQIFSVISGAVFILAFLISGYEILAGAAKGLFSHFSVGEDLLMSIASLCALALGEFFEAAAVVFFYSLGEIIEDKSVLEAENAQSSLEKLFPDHAHLINGGNDIDTPVKNIACGDIIRIKPGERVPLDIEIIEGASDFDMSHISGEGLFVAKKIGDTVFGGALCVDGEIAARVLHSEKDSMGAKIRSLISEAEKDSAKSVRFINAFAKIYTPAVLSAALLFAVLPPAFGIMAQRESIKSALFIAVISCPCAFVISIPLCFYNAKHILSRDGILIKDSAAIEETAKIKTAVFDKTGTLSEGEFEICGQKSEKGYSDHDVLLLASSIEKHSTHPIAKAFLQNTDIKEVKNFKSIVGVGCEGEIDGDLIFVGKRDNDGISVLKNGKLIGRIYVRDKIKADAKEGIARLHKMKIKTLMLTGDGKENADYIAKETGMEYKSDLLPEDKLKILKGIGGRICFVGDGVNDSPSLEYANVGIAMGKDACDTAKDSADVIVFSGKVISVARAVCISKKTMRILYENITLSIVIKIAVFILSLFGMGGVSLPVFADVGTMLIAVFNTRRIAKS